RAEQETIRVSEILEERVKELTTLYGVAQIFQQEDKSTPEVLQELVDIIPQGWQHNESTAARIVLGGIEYKSFNYQPGHKRQQQTFLTADDQECLVEVVYSDPTVSVTKDQFEAEERKLLNLIVEMLRIALLRKHENQELKKSEANLSTILDTTDTIYVLLDNDFKVISYNQRAADFALKELHQELADLHETFMAHFSPERQPVLADWLRSASTGDHVMYEVAYPQSDKSFHSYFVKMFPITGAGKKKFGLMLSVSDITEKKFLEAEVLDREVQEQKKITRAVLKAQESERNKIGQELHDNVNQILASTKLYLTMAVSDTPANSTQFIKSAIDFVQDAIMEIRTLSSKEVSPLKEIDLKELIYSLVEVLNSNSKIQTKFNYDIPVDKVIEDDLKLNIYRIIQEQINNMVKHAKPTHASISLRGNNGSLYLQVSDDGQGFDAGKQRKGIGISNMINRVQSYNGELTITSSPGKGCKTEIRIPY
ncbi:MAG: hypothetical protein H7Y31_15140, partial [Chitinophagaceae bacterium]|nr:hypothetical protein [Chitinophagaceae bacterium]